MILAFLKSRLAAIFYETIKIDGAAKSLEPKLVKLFRTVGANNHSPAIRANDYSPLQRTRRESGDKSRFFTRLSRLRMTRQRPKTDNAAQSSNGANTGRVRLFVAIALPDFVKDALAKLQADIKKSGFSAKWTPPENIHLTMKFLGDTPVSAIEAIGRELASAADGFPPLTLRAQGLSVFPGPRRARVLWTGTGGETDRLAVLHQQVEDNLAAIGFDKEARPFKAHLTIARFKGHVDPEAVIAVMTRYGDFASESFKANALSLFESRLTPQGPVYRKLQSYGLTGWTI